MEETERNLERVRKLLNYLADRGSRRNTNSNLPDKYAREYIPLKHQKQPENKHGEIVGRSKMKSSSEEVPIKHIKWGQPSLRANQLRQHVDNIQSGKWDDNKSKEEPVTLLKKKGQYHAVDGHHRLMAHKIIGKKQTITANVYQPKNETVNNSDSVVAKYDPRLGRIKRRFKSRSQVHTVFHKKAYPSLRDIINIINKGTKQAIVINPKYKDPDPHNRGTTAAAKSIRGKQMKEELSPLETVQLWEAIGSYLAELMENGEDVNAITEAIMSGDMENPFADLIEDMRGTTGSRYLEPKPNSTASSAHRNPYPSKRKPSKTMKFSGGSKVKLENQDYVEARQLLNLFLHDPNPFERDRAEVELEEALQTAANFFRQVDEARFYNRGNSRIYGRDTTSSRFYDRNAMKTSSQASGLGITKKKEHSDSGLYHAFKGLAGSFKKAKADALKATAYSSQMKKMKKESSYTGGVMTEAINQASSNNFIDAYAKVKAYGQHMENGRMVEDAVHKPVGHGYDTSSMVSTNPKGLNVGASDNAKDKLTEPQLDDPHGVHWSSFFLDKGGADSCENDMQMMATLYDYCAKKLGFNPTGE